METLKKIEHTLILHFKPTFIWVDLPNEQGDIHVVISCLRFNYLTIQERILDIYNLLNWKIPDILSNGQAGKTWINLLILLLSGVMLAKKNMEVCVK